MLAGQRDTFLSVILSTKDTKWFQTRLGEGDNSPKCSFNTPNHLTDTRINSKQYGPLLPLASKEYITSMSIGNEFIYFLFRFTG